MPAKSTKMKKSETKTEKTVTIAKDLYTFLEETAKANDLKTPSEVLESILSDGYLIFFDETVGKAEIKPLPAVWQDPILANLAKEATTETAQLIQAYRDLRQNCHAVSAGIEHYLAFILGGGIYPSLRDPSNAHEKEMRKAIQDLNRIVFQDLETAGLYTIVERMLDISMTEGYSAAEVVYEKEVSFDEIGEDGQSKWITKEVLVGEGGKRTIRIEPKELTEAQWKGLGGITKLKIIEDASTKLIPVRDPKSYQILYYEYDITASVTAQKKVIKFLPWEIFSIPWNPTGINIKGLSLIRGALEAALRLRQIERLIGKGYERWANSKFFLICGTERRPWSKPHIKAFLKKLDEMIRQGGQAMPVPWGFDYKQIGGAGGEAVFEGRNFLEHLIAAVAIGMKFPREFLTYGRATISEKAWLAWQARIGWIQQKIKTHIEQQIWKRHLWCKFGFDHRVPKKGVDIKEQERELTFVPECTFIPTGQWTLKERLQLLRDFRNVANPVGPELSLELEKAIAKALGMEIDWSVAEQILKMNQEDEIGRLKFRAELPAEERFKVVTKGKKKGEVEAQEGEPEEEKEEPEEEKLKTQLKKRQAAGVSVAKKVGPTKKGLAKKLGGPRGRVAETLESSEVETSEKVEESLTRTSTETIEPPSSDKKTEEKIEAEKSTSVS